jgi:hypothetical protein
LRDFCYDPFQTIDSTEPFYATQAQWLPAGAPGDVYPNWITSSWPPESMEILEWQWKEKAFSGFLTRILAAILFLPV